ncbi:MAG: Ig-like domain-containing protein, partial [Myxococcota bacterium]|nr:Ig-like domain-containing protein [Myxococcota bacterium]
MRHLWIPSLLIACGDSEEGLKVYNSEPTTTITSHAEGVELQEGVEYTFIGNANDDNHAASTLLVKWSTDARELCPETVPDADGTTSCRIALEASDTQLKLQVTDPEGASAISSINVSVLETGAPDIVFLSPTVDGAYYADQLIQFAAQISDPEDDVYDLSYEWSSSVEGVLPLTEAPDSDGTIESYMMLTEGQHAISLSVTDTTGKSTSESVVIQVGGPNQEPLCEITEPASSSTFSVGENITFLGTASDEDINNSLLSVQWASDQDGVINSSAPNTAGELNFVTNSLSAGNHIITLQVEDEIGGLCTDTLLLSLGTPPSISIEEPTNGSIYSVGEAVFFTAIVSDSEDLASDISLSWTSHIDGEFYTQSSDSNGNIYFAYSDLSAGIHNILATATDGSGLTSTASLTLQINTPPPAPTVEITPNPSNTSDVLQVLLTESADADGDAISYTYQWYQNGTTTSYTSETVVSTATSAGDLWKVRVTPNDGFVDGEYAEASVIIANSEPTVDSISLSPTTAYNDSTLTCSATASDADQTLSIDYSWYVGSNLIGTGTTLDVSTVSVMPNTILTCEASVVDDAGSSASAQASVELENRAPTVSSVQIDTSVLYNDALVSCAGTVSDDDGETASQVVTWSIGGVTVGSTDSIQLDASLLSVGQTLTCTIEASDGYGGTASGSASLTASNRSPVIDSMTLSPASPYRTDTLTCTGVYDDPDTDSTTANFSWSNSSSGATYTATSETATTSSLDLSTLGVAAGDSIVCDLLVTDAQGDVQSTSQ